MSNLCYLLPKPPNPTPPPKLKDALVPAPNNPPVIPSAAGAGAPFPEVLPQLEVESTELEALNPAPVVVGRVGNPMVLVLGGAVAPGKVKLGPAPAANAPAEKAVLVVAAEPAAKPKLAVVEVFGVGEINAPKLKPVVVVVGVAAETDPPPPALNNEVVLGAGESGLDGLALKLKLRDPKAPPAPELKD